MLLRLFNVLRGLNKGVQDEFIKDDELSDVGNFNIEKGILKKRPGLIGERSDLPTNSSTPVTLLDNMQIQSGHLVTFLNNKTGNFYQLNRGLLDIFSNNGEDLGIVFNQKGITYNYKYFSLLNKETEGNLPKIASISSRGTVDNIYYWDVDRSKVYGIGHLNSDKESLLGVIPGNYKGITYIDNSVNIDDTETKELRECRFVYDGSSDVNLYDKFGGFLDKITVGNKAFVTVTTAMINNEPTSISQTSGITLESDVSTDVTQVTVRGNDYSGNYTSWFCTLTGTAVVTIAATSGIDKVKSIFFFGERKGICTLKNVTHTLGDTILTVSIGISSKVYDGYKKYVVTGIPEDNKMIVYGYSAGFTAVSSVAVANMGEVRIVTAFNQEIAAYEDSGNSIRFHSLSSTAIEYKAGQDITVGATVVDIDAPVYSYADGSDYPAFIAIEGGAGGDITFYNVNYNTGTSAISYTKYKILKFEAYNYIDATSALSIASVFKYMKKRSMVLYYLCVENVAGGHMKLLTIDLKSYNVIDTRNLGHAGDGTPAFKYIKLYKNYNDSGWFKVSEIWTPESANLHCVAINSTPTFNSNIGICFEDPDGNISPPTDMGKIKGDEILIYNIPTGITGVVKRHICYYDSTNIKWNIIYTLDDNTTKNIILSTLTIGAGVPGKHFFAINAVHIGTRGNRLVILGKLKDRFTWFRTKVNEEYIGADDYDPLQEYDAADLTAVVDTADASYMFTDNSVWRVSGYDEVSFSQVRISGKVGAPGINAIQVINNVVLFVGVNGVYAIQGSQIVKISEKIKEYVDTKTWKDSVSGVQTGIYQAKFCIFGLNRDLIIYDTDLDAWTIYDFGSYYYNFITSNDADYYSQMFFLHNNVLTRYCDYALNTKIRQIEFVWDVVDTGGAGTPDAGYPKTYKNGILSITSFNYLTLATEKVVIKNNCSFAINLSSIGLYLYSNKKGSVYNIPDLTLASGLSVSIWSKVGTNDDSNLYMNKGAAYWSDNGDVLYLGASTDSISNDLKYDSVTAFAELKKITFGNPTIDRLFEEIYMYCKDTNATLKILPTVDYTQTSTSVTLLGTDNNVMRKIRPDHGHGSACKIRVENSDEHEVEIYGFEIKATDIMEKPQ